MANVQKELIDTYDGKGFAAEYAGYAERASKDENGNDIASTYATKTENDEKADKVASATSGNFAGLNANGNLTDSGSKASDFATATALSTHTSDSTIHVTANDKSTWSGKQNTISTQNVTTSVDANTPIATGYSSDKISFNTAGRVATYVSSKVSSDLGITSSAYGGKAATAGSADFATTAGSAGSATNATNATNVNLTGSVKTTSTTNGDTIQVKAGAGTAAEITLVNAKHAAYADSAISATNVNLTGSISETSTASGDTIKVQAGTGTAAEIPIVNAYHAATADSAANANNAINATHAGDLSVHYTTASDFNRIVGDQNRAGQYSLRSSSLTHGPKGDASAEYTGLVWVLWRNDCPYQLYIDTSMASIRYATTYDSESGLWSGWSAWANTSDASWISSGTFLADRIGGSSTSGQYLKSRGSNTAPIWDDTANLSVGTTQNVATQGDASDNTARHVWFSDSTTETKRAHSDNLKYTPSTNTITANVSGTASNLAASGTSGYYLKSNGGSTAPEWANPDDLYVGRAHNADHVYSAGDSNNNGGHILVVNDRTQGSYEPYVTPNVRAYYSSSQGSSIRVGNTSGATTSDRKGSIVIGNGANAGTIFADNLTSFLEYQLPNAGGTLIPAVDLGTSGQYLKSNGANSAPTWADLPQSPDVSITDASDVSYPDTTLSELGKYRLNVGSKSTTFKLDVPVVYYFTADTASTNVVHTCTYNYPVTGKVLSSSLAVVTFPNGHTRDSLQLKFETGYQTGSYLTEDFGTNSLFSNIPAGGHLIIYIKAFTTYVNATIVNTLDRTSTLAYTGSNRILTFTDNKFSSANLPTYPTLPVVYGDTYYGGTQTVSNASGSPQKSLVLAEESGTNIRTFNWTDSSAYCKYVDITVRICAEYTSTFSSLNTLEICPLIRDSSTSYSVADIPELSHYFVARANTSGDMCATLNARFQYDDFYSRFHGKSLCFGVDFYDSGSTAQNITVKVYNVWTRVAHYGGT